MKKFFIIPHTHWDREWHKTFEEYRVRCVDFFDDMLDTLENSDFPCFILDGQTSVIADYLEIKPKNKERIVGLVKNGKLKIGPWYVQPDEFIPSLESLIKNLLLSKKISDEFGKEMDVGYLPDSFGQSATMPTVLCGFGIKDVVFYRGFTEDVAKKNVFIWQGIDGSEVLAQWLPSGYGNGMFLSGDVNEDVKIVNNEVASVGDRGVFGNYLLMAGSDQCFIKEHLTKAAEQLNAFFKARNQDCEFEVCKIEKYFESLRASQSEFEKVVGEFRFGKRSRVHNSIAATRQDLKTKNRNIEVLFERVLEPTSVLVELLGGKYQQELIEKGELYYIENHAHDSICSVCTDDVHREIALRIDKAEQIAKTIVENNKLAIFESINFEKRGRPIVLFSSETVAGLQKIYTFVSTKKENFKIKDKNGVQVDFQIVSQKKYNRKDEIVALSTIPDDWYFKTEIFILKELAFVGYETLYIDENDESVQKPSTMQKMGKMQTIENEFYRLCVNEKGNIDVLCKKSNLQFDDQFRIVDVGNAGDEYDYSPANQDKTVISDDFVANYTVSSGAIESQIVKEFEMYVPQTTNNDCRSSELQKVAVKSIFRLTKDINRIDVTTCIENNAENHKLSVEFNFANKFGKHFGATANGVIQRSNDADLMQKSIEEKWSELHYPVFPLCGFMFLENDFVLMSKNQLQYETSIENNATKVMLTLLSSVSKMGNENLKFRPGRRSGAVCDTPDSKMKGNYTAEYSIAFATDKGTATRQYFAKTTVINYAKYNDGGIYADKLAMIHTNIEVSSLKKSEDGRGYVVRLINRSGDELVDQTIKFNSNLFKKCEVVNLKEEKIQNERIAIEIKNNADMSNKNTFAGVCKIKSIKNGEIITLRLN